MITQTYDSAPLFSSSYAENRVIFMKTILASVSPVLGALIFNMTDTRPRLEEGYKVVNSRIFHGSGGNALVIFHNEHSGLAR